MQDLQAGLGQVGAQDQAVLADPMMMPSYFRSLRAFRALAGR